jgi:hypothetical protein
MQSVYWFIFWSAIGAFVVLVGLCMEQFSEKGWYKSAENLLRLKKVRFFGEILVIAGVFIELVVAIIIAWEERPENRDVSNASASLVFSVNRTFSEDLNKPPFPDGFDALAEIWLCGKKSKSNPVASIIGQQQMPFASDSPPILTANSYYENDSDFGKPNTAPEALRTYALNFTWPQIQKYSYEHIGGKPFKVAEMYDEVTNIILRLNFLPEKAEITDGKIDLEINYLKHKTFYVVPHKKLFFQDGTTIVFANDSPIN